MPQSPCRTCGQPRKACQCPPPLPDTTGRVVRLQRARLAALQWWCVQLVAVPDPALRATVWAKMHKVLEADEAALAPWMQRQRRPKMDPATFYRLDAHYREQLRGERREQCAEQPKDLEIADLMGIPPRTYRRYKRGQF